MKKLILLILSLHLMPVHAQSFNYKTDEFVFAKDEEDKVLKKQDDEFNRKKLRMDEQSEILFKTKRLERVRNNQFNRKLQQIFYEYKSDAKGLTLTDLMTISNRLPTKVKPNEITDIFNRRDMSKNRYLDYVEFMSNVGKDLFDRDDLLEKEDKSGRFFKIEK